MKELDDIVTFYTRRLDKATTDLAAERVAHEATKADLARAMADLQAVKDHAAKLALEGAP